MNCNLYRRGDRGVPQVAPAAFVADLWPRVTAYEDSISATGGFESCRLTVRMALDEAQYVADTWLGYALEVCGDDGAVAWQGQLRTIEFQAGGRQRSVSLDAVENRQLVRYTTVLGTPGPVPIVRSSDSGSIALFGTRDGVTSVSEGTSTIAATLRAQLLAARAYPRSTGATSVERGGDAGAGRAVEVSLSFAGWYYTLGDVRVERADATEEATTAQVAWLLATAAATNAFLSTTPVISGTGEQYTRKIEADTTARQALETRLAVGTTGGQRLAWGVYEDRVLRVATWAGATPSTVTYRVRAATADVLSVYGLIVPWWAVRPNAILEDSDLLAVGTPSGAIDGPDRMYVERVTRSVDADGRSSVAFEPSATTAIDARLARLSG